MGVSAGIVGEFLLFAITLLKASDEGELILIFGTGIGKEAYQSHTNPQTTTPLSHQHHTNSSTTIQAIKPTTTTTPKLNTGSSPSIMAPAPTTKLAATVTGMGTQANVTGDATKSGATTGGGAGGGGSAPADGQTGTGQGCCVM